MSNPVYDLILGNIEGARSPGEADPHWNLVQAVQTRAQKKEESKPYSKLKVPDTLLTTATPDEIKSAQEADQTLNKVREALQSGEEKISKGGGRSVFLAHQTEIATLFAWVIKLHLTQVFSPRLEKICKTLNKPDFRCCCARKRI